MKKLFAVAAIAGLLGSTAAFADAGADLAKADRKSTRLNSSH